MAEKNRILEIALGGLYLLSGITKLLPIPAIVETFDEFAQHFPFRLKPPGWLFLRSVGVAEMVAGYWLLSQASLTCKRLATGSMMMVMVGAWHVLYSMGEKPAMFIPSVLCFTGLAYLILTKYSGTDEQKLKTS